MKISFKTYAKINLCLRVVKKREDGYHDILSLMSKIGLFDQITINGLMRSNSFSVDLRVDGSAITDDLRNLPSQRNLIYKAASAFSRKSGICFKAEIGLDKRIPSEAGLGGGSTNAAGILMALNRVFPVFTKGALLRLAATIGADVPYCLFDRQMIALGTGDLLYKPGLKVEGYLVLVHPSCSISTKSAYNELDRIQGDLVHLTRNGLRRRYKQLGLSSFSNDFEKVAFLKFPELGHIKEELLALDAAFALMSGSGSTVYGLFADRYKAQLAYGSLLKKYAHVSFCELR